MAQMLQALKNLEARGAKPATKKGPSPRQPSSNRPPSAAKEALLDISLKDASLLPPPPTEPAKPPIPSRQASGEERPAPTANTLVIEKQTTEPVKSLPPRVETPREQPSPSPTIVLSKESQTTAPASCQLVRSIRRTLQDPHRAQPLREMADHLRRDVIQTGSKTILFVGLGPSSAHEPLFYTSALIAEQSKALLVDANLARRPVSDGFELQEQPGLAELLRASESPFDHCRPTGIDNLSILPAGLLRHVDLSTAGQRVEEILRALAAEFSPVLIDGGSSADLAATTLARLCDATYFVVQLGAVEADEAQAALRDFRATGARVLGCIAT